MLVVVVSVCFWWLYIRCGWIYFLIFVNGFFSVFCLLIIDMLLFCLFIGCLVVGVYCC